VRGKPLLRYTAVIAVLIGTAGFIAVHTEVGKQMPTDDQSTRGLFFWLLAGAGILYFVITGSRRSMQGTGAELDEPARAETVRRSGSVLASARVPCRVGDPSTPTRSLVVTVCPGGIVAKSRFTAERAVLASEIRGMWASREWRQDKLIVEHEGVGMPSPLVVWTSIDKPLGVAIRALAPAQPLGSPAPHRLKLHGAERGGGFVLLICGVGSVVLGLAVFLSAGPIGLFWAAASALFTYHVAAMMFAKLPAFWMAEAEAKAVTPPDAAGRPE
jgi:hypothetical protein